MKSSPSLLVSILITIGIIISLATASVASIVLFSNLLVANAQPALPTTSQPETQQDEETTIRQGTVTSSQDPLPGHEQMQMATILPFREDGTIYSGVLTFTASASVEVVILNMQTLNETEQSILNATDSSESKTPFTSQLDDETSLSVSYIIPPYDGSPVPSASIPFVGNAVWLPTLHRTPFAATFAVNALVLPSEIQNIFNSPSETIDTVTPEDHGVDAEETEDADVVNTTATDNEAVSEEAEEETDEGEAEVTEEDTTADFDDDSGLASTAANNNNAGDDNGSNNEEVIVRIPQGFSSLTNDAYNPNPVEVNTGNTVTWVNDDLTSHTATSGTPDSGSTGMFGGTDDSPEIIGPEGDTQSFTFNEPGEFEYYAPAILAW